MFLRYSYLDTVFQNWDPVFLVLISGLVGGFDFWSKWGHSNLRTHVAPKGVKFGRRVDVNDGRLIRNTSGGVFSLFELGTVRPCAGDPFFRCVGETSHPF